MSDKIKKAKYVQRERNVKRRTPPFCRKTGPFSIVYAAFSRNFLLVRKHSSVVKLGRNMHHSLFF